MWRFLLAGLILSAPILLAEDAAVDLEKPQHERKLTREDANKAAELQQKIEELEDADDYAGASRATDELLSLRKSSQGADHWETVDLQWFRDAQNKIAALTPEKRAGWRKALLGAQEARRLDGKEQLANAQPLWQEYRRWCEQTLGETHPDTASCYNNLAHNLNLLGKNSESLLLYQKALEIRRKVLGEEHPSTGASYNNLASILQDQAKHAEAHPLYQKGLDIRRKVLGEEHPSTADSYNNVASNLGAQAKHVQAMPLHQKALDIRRKVFGEEHPDTADSYNNLASSLDSQGKFAESLPLLQKALDIRRKALGERHRFTADSYNNVAGNLNAQAKYAEARLLYQKSLDIRREVLGEEHPDTASGYNNLAMNLCAQAKYAEAHPLLEKALDIRRKALGEDHSSTADSYNNVASNLQDQGKHAEAHPLYQKALDIRRKVLGEEHSRTADSYNNMASNLDDQGKFTEAQPWYEKAVGIRRRVLGESHPSTAAGYNNLASNLYAQARYAEAQPLFQKALDIWRGTLGEDHPTIARCYNNMAASLLAQGRYVEAQPLFQKALDIRRKALGEEHPDTAVSYNNLGTNLDSQARYAEALPLKQKALDICRKSLGEEHATTATRYGNIAANLHAQGKYAEAQPLFQKSLDIYRKALGEEHPDTARGYSNLAAILDAQAKYAEAEPLYRMALDIRRRMLGEEHPSTALNYTNLAATLNSQGNDAEAQRLHQKALDICLKLFGDDHPDTARGYNNLASILSGREKYAEAQPLYQKALEINRRILGEEHPSTATGYGNVAINLGAQAQFAEAQPLYRKALDIRRKVLGEEHPETADGYSNEAFNLHALSKDSEALVSLGRAIHAHEASRQAGAKNLDRAALETINPRGLLAAILADTKPTAAWEATEMTLARGLLDQHAAQLPTALTSVESVDQLRWRNELNDAQSQILVLATKSTRSDGELKQLEDLIAQRQRAGTKLAEIAVRVSQREVAASEAILAALPAESALMIWVDESDKSGLLQEHWGCVVRPSGEPKWERLPGSGRMSQWTKDEESLSVKLRNMLVSNESSSDVASIAKQVYEQRMAPLMKHLRGVKTLYVVPVNNMAGVPIEALTSDFTISYVPSGTFLARLKEQAQPAGDALLAVADPVFADSANQPIRPSSLPPGGLLITQVVPGGGASAAQIKAGDVLLKYGDTELTDVDKLKEAVAANAAAKTIPVTVWREDAEKPFVRDVAPGKLGVLLEKDPAPFAIANRRKSNAMLLALRGGDWGDLPGTRVEASRIGQLIGTNATVLADSAASEQKLEAMRQAGDLKKYRYLHFATHGEGNNVRAFESALILAQDTLPKDPLPRAGEPFLNGQLSAAEVLEFWKLDAELVTLSACETAVGRQGGGDGPLGFAQAFLTAGARSVCLSLWKVDDTATTLLMDRFYQNLLGKRPGLEKPMGKAGALAEAKNWLRNLPSDEALKLTADMTKGVVRGKGQKALPIVAVPKTDDPATAKTFKPFDHTKYWAAFILIGDPN